MNRCLLLAMAAGAACSSVATAQEVQEFVNRDSAVRMFADGTTGQVSFVDQNGGYDSRATGTVYDSDTNGLCYIFLGANYRILEDIEFAPGPWAAAGPQIMREFTVPIGNSLGANTATANYDLQINVWSATQASFVTNPMVTAGATPLFTGTFPIRSAPQLAFLTISNFNAGAGVNLSTVAGTDVYFELVALAPGTTNQLALTAGSVFVMGDQHTFAFGATANNFGRDANNNSVLAGTATPSTTSENALLAFATGTCAARNLVFPMSIRGDVPATPPATFTDLGTLSDAGLVRTDALAANGVRWYRFNLPGDVTDTRRTFLDIDTEGSSLSPNNDTNVVFYDNAGNLLAVDANDGSADLSALTFGIGNRSRVGDGRVFDGRDGELLATDGPYWIGIGGFPAGAVDDGWVFTSTSTNVGNVSLNFRTNSLNAGPLAASVEPDFILIDNGNPLLAPGVPTTAVAPGNPGVLWYKFTTCKPTNAGSASDYVDIDFSQSAFANGIDQIAFIFNAQGNLLATSDDEGPAGLPQFSFGGSSPRNAYSGNGADPVYGGESGTLPAGTYYLAVTFFPANALATAETDGRWHVRPEGGDNVDIKADFYTGFTDCNVVTCGSADFDGDGDSGTDADIESFFACLAGNCCATCFGADFDGDGDTGTDADIEAFFRVLAGQPC